jgi:hypothetical protein
MDDSDSTFLDMVRYFHQAKGDVTRYCYWDEDRFRKLAPGAWRAWRTWRTAVRTLDIEMSVLGE